MYVDTSSWSSLVLHPQLDPVVLNHILPGSFVKFPENIHDTALVFRLGTAGLYYSHAS